MYRRSLVEAVTAAVKAGMARGEIDPARKIVSLLQHRDPTNEVVLRLGLQLDHLCGDLSALHRRYVRFRELIKSEFDAAPSGDSQRLFQELSTSSSAALSQTSTGTSSPAEAALRAESSAQITLTPQGDATIPVSVSWPAVGGWTKLAAFGCAISVLLALGWIFWTGQTASSRHEPLLAVLPFDTPKADAGSRYFSDGITEEIVDALLRATQVRVVSPGSSFRFRRAGAARAAKDLAATHVLSGSVERSGGRIHLIAQMTDMQDGNVIWSQTYDRTIEQAPALRRDIAVQIADALDMRLSATSRKEEQINPAAYDHYLKGRDLFLERNLEAAEPELEAATRLAPKMSKAWSTLAAARIVHVSRLFLERREDDEALMEMSARTAANRALALDPDDGEALAVLAHLTPSTHLREIERLFQRALRSEPNNTQLLNWHGAFLWFVGRNREALDELTRAYEIDRITPTVAQNLAAVLLWAGRYEESERLTDLARDSRLRTEFFQLREQDFLFRRDWAGLVRLVRTLPDFLSPPNAALFRLCRETATILEQNRTDQYGRLRTRWRSTTEFPTEAVQFLSALGDQSGALIVVRSAVDRHRATDRYLIDPGWTALFPANLAALRGDPQVIRLFVRWGLFDYWRSSGSWPDFCYEPDLPFDCKRAAEEKRTDKASTAVP